jgi:nucleoside-diphosphate-sugar epimerase
VIDIMRALVTGAAGFVGRRAVVRLTELGIRVRGLIRRDVLHRDGAARDVEWARGDITDPRALAVAAAGCDLVFHCAWGGTTLAEARLINVGGTRAVVEAAASAGVRRIVHLSTMAVHGSVLPPVLTEEAPFCLDGEPYGVSKAEGEREAFTCGAACGVEVVALRPTLVYGPRAPLWVLAYFERVKNGQVALIDGGRGLVNLVYVDDLVDAMWRAATIPAAAGEAFLVSGPAPVTWRDYLGSFAAMCRKPLPPTVSRRRAQIEMQWLRVYGTLAQRPRRLQGMDVKLMTQCTAVSIAKARDVLGFVPEVDLARGMASCEHWLRDEGYLPSGVRAGRRPLTAPAALGSDRAAAPA